MQRAARSAQVPTERARAVRPAVARDPRGWIAIIVFVFAVVVFRGLDTIANMMFDEIHYVPASRAWVGMLRLLNPEHPVLGKQIMALSIRMFGDNAFGWRLPAAVSGCLSLLAVMRIAWHARGSRFATISAGIFTATNFVLLVQSRIAMLDGIMLAFLLLGCWALVAAVVTQRHVRARVILAGVLFGLSFAVKWNGAPVIAYAGLCVFAGNLLARFGLTRRPLGRMTIFEAGAWLGAVPLAIYFASFETIRLLRYPNTRFTGPVEWQQYMMQLQESVTKPHNYMSQWWQWVLDLRPIWYFYQEYEGAWRGLLMLGNPLQMWVGLVALLGCLWLGLRRRRWDCLVLAGGWMAAIGMWVVAPKPVQFYYHYLICAMFLSIALALVLDAAVWQQPFRRVKRGWAVAFHVLNAAVFLYFFKILTTLPLAGKGAFTVFAVLKSWR